MVCEMDRGEIVGVKRAGLSNREISRRTGHDRETVSKVWNRHCEMLERLKKPGADTRAIQEEMKGKPLYNGGRRVTREKRKRTPELEERLRAILESEKTKTRRLGASHKQGLTNNQIHAQVREEGFDIGVSTVCVMLAEMRKKQREVYICQQYELGDRLEYDFGEVRLNCGEGMKTYHMAVLSSSGGKFMWAYLYTNQKQGVFLDSHVRFFEMMGCVYTEVVYDNMRNVVKKFIGKNEKELNAELRRMADYYGYEINVTNCFKGNEKGRVESSVKILRNEIFSSTYDFGSLEEAREYLKSQLLKLNAGSRMEEEKQHLLPYMPPWELAELSNGKVNPSSMVSVDTAFYSVPEHLVGIEVKIKKYHDEVRVYADNEPVCKHRRVLGNGKMRADIYHYLNTFLRKPGAVRNSVALKSIPRLKAIFDTHFSKQPKKFIEIFMADKELPIEEMIALFDEKTKRVAELNALDVVKPVSNVDVSVRTILINYGALINRGVSE
jgi:transposase